MVGARSDNAFRIEPSGKVTLLVASPGAGPGKRLDFPNGVAAGLAGDAYVLGNNSGNVLHIAADGTIREVLKQHRKGGGLGMPSAVAVASDGTVYVSRFGARVLWRIAPDGRVSGLLEEPYPEGTPKLGFIRDVLVGKDGGIYLAENRSHLVLRLLSATPGS